MGHLNTCFDPGDGNLNNPNFKSSNARGVARGGGMLKFPFDRYIIVLVISPNQGTFSRGDVVNVFMRKSFKSAVVANCGYQASEVLNAIFSFCPFKLYLF